MQDVNLNFILNIENDCFQCSNEKNYTLNGAVDIEVCNSSLAKFFRKLLRPFVRTNQAIFFSTPAAKHKAATWARFILSNQIILQNHGGSQARRSDLGYI